MATRISGLEDHIGYLVRQVSNHVSHAFARKVAARGVTVAEWAMMRVMYEQDDMPPSRIAAQMGMTRGAVTKLADRLIAKGLIAWKADRADQRSHALRLTKAALKLVPKLAALADVNDAECFRHLSERDRRTFVDILTKTIAHLGIAAVPTK